MSNAQYLTHLWVIDFPYRNDMPPEVREVKVLILSETEKAFRIAKNLHDPARGWKVVKKSDFDTIVRGNLNDSHRTLSREIYCFPQDRTERRKSLIEEMKKVYETMAADYAAAAKRWSEYA